jgi:branched-chain amino acid transport system permease protein
MQQQSVTATQFSLVAGLPLFLLAVVGGLASVGDGLFTGATTSGAFTALVEVAPWSANLAALLPALAGLGLGRNPDGLVPALRAGGYAALGRLAQSRLAQSRLARSRLVPGRLVPGRLVPSRLAPGRRPAAPGEPDIPVEWWGLRRDWRPEDGEVLARGIAGG